MKRYRTTDDRISHSYKTVGPNSLRRKIARQIVQNVDCLSCLRVSQQPLQTGASYAPPLQQHGTERRERDRNENF